MMMIMITVMSNVHEKEMTTVMTVSELVLPVPELYSICLVIYKQH